MAMFVFIAVCFVGYVTIGVALLINVWAGLGVMLFLALLSFLIIVKG